MRHIFGRFDDADLHLLGLLANQAAAALENAALVSTLEKKVEERTTALRSANENLAARNDELAIINVVQHSLAAKFTHEGAITVNAHQESGTLIINVADTGIGMNEAALGRVFEEFQQADATTRKEYGGTGLGMPISKHLAQLLGGDLTVTSSVAEGSTFTLTLPVEAVVS